VCLQQGCLVRESEKFKVDVHLCTSFTNFHPESWSPVYNIGTLLKSLVSFFHDDLDSSHYGSERCSPRDRVNLAAASKSYNVDRKFYDMFVDDINVI
jgi:ubiquitin-conjugating enzyme E2 J2